MHSKRTLRQVAVTLLLLVAFLFQGTWALAGTTGGLSGTVTDEAGAPVSGATVKVASASQVGSVTTDASGHFTFLSLTPDTYSVSIEKDGFNPISYSGVVVFADQSQTLTFKLTKALKTIAKVTSVAAGALVRAGTTSDVYSVNSATASHITGLGGGGGLDNAYSAIATVPGAFVPVGGNGWYQNVYIRGGDYDQVGYEVDGVPVNRSFDNYPSNTQSALGQQEVQVYTGASPSNAEGQGLAGFINQVIKTGTYPGFASSDLGIGGPTFYHKANIEVGGATPDRNFSYYAGFGGYDQAFRYYDQNNGAGISQNYGIPFAPCAGASPQSALPSCFDSTGTFQSSWTALGPYNMFSVSDIADRENVLNFHFAIPHRKDGGRDDLQLLYQTSSLTTDYYSSPSDWGGPASAAVGYSPFFFSGVIPGAAAFGGSYSGPLGQPLPANYQSLVTPYSYPSQPTALGNAGAIPANLRDSSNNGVGIVKVQYQRNMGSDAYLRVYGYTVYSNWFLYGPNSLFSNYDGINPADYELESHTRGVSATFADQLNSKNLLSIQGSYTTATAIRDNNTQPYAAFQGQPLALAVSSANPYDGICYAVAGATATPTACGSSKYQDGNPTQLSLANALLGTAPTSLAGVNCSGAPCEYLAVENGQSGTYNQVTPKFTSGSITDEFDPTDRLHINIGVRFDRFEFDPQNTNTGPARNLFFNSWNNAMCVANTPGANPTPLLGTAAGAAAFAAGFTAANGGCSTLNANGITYTQALLTNTPVTQSFSVFQPRVAFTYTVNPQNVLRFSYGKYDQAPNTAFEQYNTSQQDLPDLLGPTFYAYGRTSPTYPIVPEVSYNTDFSWEHQIKGTDMSFKVTPFYRKTNDQVEQFYLNLKTNFVSGLNVGQQTSSGVEFQLQKGDFSRNGFAGLFSYTYTSAKIKYNRLANGGSIIDPINGAISQYNAYTSQCAAGGADVGQKVYGQYLCGGSGASPFAAQCFVGGVAGSCSAAGAVANPYYNSAAQGFFDPSGSYAPYDLFPAASIGGGSYSSFVAPNVATLILNYKHDKLSITPAWQFQTGTHYGFPISTPGVAPNTCTALAGSTRYNATTCGTIDIPNPATGAFDGMGAFTNPSRLTMSTQISYELSPRVTSVLTLTNIFDTCFGGTKNAWTSAVGVPQSKICSYGSVGVGAIPPVGNVYNPGQSIQPAFANSYSPQFGSLPFNAYLDFRIKI